jgi:creatine kinase
MVWVGGEDHLKIMCLNKGLLLNTIFDRLRSASVVVEKYADRFARSKTFGFVTSCPSNLGSRYQKQN